MTFKATQPVIEPTCRRCSQWRPSPLPYRFKLPTSEFGCRFGWAAPHPWGSTAAGLQVAFGDFPTAGFATRRAHPHVLLLCICCPGGDQPPEHLLFLLQKLLYQLFPRGVHLRPWATVEQFASYYSTERCLGTRNRAGTRLRPQGTRLGHDIQAGTPNPQWSW